MGPRIPIKVVELERVAAGVNIFKHVPLLPALQINFIPCIPGRIGGKHVHPPAISGWGQSKSPFEELFFFGCEVLVVGWDVKSGSVSDVLTLDSRQAVMKVTIPAGVAHLTMTLGSSPGMLVECFCLEYVQAEDQTERFDTLPPDVQKVVDSYQRELVPVVEHRVSDGLVLPPLGGQAMEDMGVNGEPSHMIRGLIGTRAPLSPMDPSELDPHLCV